MSEPFIVKNLVSENQCGALVLSRRKLVSAFAFLFNDGSLYPWLCS